MSKPITDLFIFRMQMTIFLMKPETFSRLRLNHLIHMHLFYNDCMTFLNHQNFRLNGLSIVGQIPLRFHTNILIWDLKTNDRHIWNDMRVSKG